MCVIEKGRQGKKNDDEVFTKRRFSITYHCQYINRGMKEIVDGMRSPTKD